MSPNPGPSWKAFGTGDFNGDSHSDVLFQNASSGQASIWEMSGNTLIGGGPVNPNPGPAWQAIGTGDFNHDGDSDILFQSTNTGQVSIWEMNGNKLIGGGPVSANLGPSWFCGRDRRRRRLRHPSSERERPSLDLGDEREQNNRRRTRQPQSRAELVRGRADGIKLAYLRNYRRFMSIANEVVRFW